MVLKVYISQTDTSRSIEYM